MRLLLPLKYYDEAGRIKPSTSFLWCLFYLCRPFWVFVASLTFRQDSGALLTLFYPDNYYFYLSLGIAFPALLVALLISFRTKLWHSRARCVFQAIVPLVMLSLISDIGFHVSMAFKQHWEFSWLVALTLLLDCIYLYWVKKNLHLRLMAQDWAKE
ncbi:hypothetical protein FX988_00072 [Paraglaciecola mesophila]|uniref:DUF2919 domain-containing protein n=1 Tax=Paraglaciecola mesophila TaxID=197222 RepID=A0A857JGP2_9ALTE|nr:DUF2919 family protein [Paraglaciecola mesophila]QHJ09864.1 hypothetical protein FX988_00072 [Paraglaciecola mesophila]